MVYKRKKYHYGDTHLKKKWRTKRRTKDLDEVTNKKNTFLFCLHDLYFFADRRRFETRKF